MAYAVKFAMNALRALSFIYEYTFMNNLLIDFENYYYLYKKYIYIVLWLIHLN